MQASHHHHKRPAVIGFALLFVTTFGLTSYLLGHIEQNSPQGDTTIVEPDDAVLPYSQKIVLSFDGLNDTLTTGAVQS